MNVKWKIKHIMGGVAAIVSCIVLSLPATVSASVKGGVDSVKNEGGMATNEVESIVPNIVATAMWAVGVVSVIIIVIAGISYATAQGDESKTKKARKAILGALIGLALAILSYTITYFVSSQL
jgi:cytochrome bd-type quinol oxidase subunit 2